MKKYRIIIIALIAMISFNSCKKFLTTELTDATQTNTSYYKTPSQAFTALVGCYNGLDIIYNNDAVPAELEVYSDNSFGGTGTYDGYGWEMMDEFDKTVSTSDVSIHSSGWQGYYQAIYWNGKPEDIVSDPPLEQRLGGRGVGWMTAEQGKGIKTWVQEGGSLWAFHNDSEASIHNQDYRDAEGAIYVGHPPIRPFKVHIVNPDHPITKGVKDFVVTDEQHYVVYDKDPKYVLARSINENGLDYTDNAGRRSNTAESVWAYDYGKGRVCFMAPGHAITVMWNPEYEKMQKNAVKWLLHQA